MLAQFQSRCAAAGLRRAVMLVLDNDADSRKTILAFFGARAGHEAGVLGSAAEGSRRQRIDIHEFFTADRRKSRMAAELGMVAFKLERLALKLKSYLCSSLCASKVT